MCLVRIAAAPSFPGLRRFPEGRGFKQWTGDDSKALMKVGICIVLLLVLMNSLVTMQVYLPAIASYVPSQMLRAVSSFMEFCYLVRRSVLDEDDIDEINRTIIHFHQERKIFEREGVRPDGISLPRQHSLVHYAYLITEFGAPNGLCSSITESKHIKAVKDPWRRSNHHNALSQMLLTNQRLDKLAASRVDFQARGMLNAPLLDYGAPPMVPDPVLDADDDDGGAIDTHDILGEVTLARIPGM
jgi:hypothetical protein